MRYSMDNENQIPEPAELTPDENDALNLLNHNKLSSLDTAILTLKRTNPQMTAYQVGQALLKHKLSKSNMTVYTRLKRNDYLSKQSSKRLKIITESSSYAKTIR